MPHNIVVVGLDFRTAAIEIREQLSLSGCALEAALQHLAGNSPVAQSRTAPFLATETVILSTCNRLEFYLLVEDDRVAREIVAAYLADARGIPASRITGRLYCQVGEGAVEHLMRVASGLESMILGEPQILGQVSRAYEEARAAGTVGPLLSHLFAAALHCGKRAHCETEIGAFTGSLSHAAADLLAAELPELGASCVLVVGAGEMATLAAQAIRDHGAAQLFFINRSQAAAEALAARFGGSALPWRDLRSALASADAVVSATAAPHLVIMREDVELALATRQGAGLLLVDLALPRDIDPAIEELPGARCFDVDRLSEAVAENLARRAAAAPAVEAIVAQEQYDLARWLRARAAVPTVVDLRSKAQKVAAAELARTLRRLDPDDDRLARELGCMAHRIINKLLHEPTIRLKEQAVAGDGALYRQAVQELFGLTRLEATASGDEAGAATHD